MPNQSLTGLDMSYAIEEEEEEEKEQVVGVLKNQTGH